MSVAPAVAALPPHLIPQRLRIRFPRARGKDAWVVFRMGDGVFDAGAVSAVLALRPDSPTHGVVEPALEMGIDAFQQALASTQACWVDGESAG
mgnify:FL=1